MTARRHGRAGRVQGAKDCADKQADDQSKRTEAALRTSQAQLRLITDALPSLIAYVDADQRYRFNNKAYEDWFKRPREELYGKRVEEVLGEAAYQTVREHLERVLTGQPVSYQRQVPYKTGGARYTSTMLVPDISEGREVKGYVAMVSDITAAKQAEEALRQSEQRYRSLAMAAAAIVWNAAPNGMMADDIPSWELFTGQAPDQYKGWGWLEAVHPEDRESTMATWAGALDAHTSAAAEFRLKDRNGHYRYVIGRAVPVCDGAGAVREWVGTCIDIDERKQMENALRAVNEELERRVEHRTAELANRAAELKQVNEALTRSNAELQQFAYVASHDLQAPLRSISGFTQALQSDYAGRLDPQADEWIRRTVQSTQTMRTMINDLLAYARVDTHARPFERIHLGSVCDEVISLLDASIRESNADIRHENLPLVLGDRSQLVQLMQNLLANAIKFHGDQPPCVRVSANANSKEWVVTVRDNGIGIDPQYHERIFELFQRLHNQREYPGTGIGLALCRRVITLHGGRIWLESEPGRGSVFNFTFPENLVSTS